MLDLRRIDTEKRNERTKHIDEISTIDMVRLINEEDKKVAGSVEKVLPSVAKAIDIIADKLRQGGRLIYCGCGTSGRIGILDAAECPPTYSTDPELVQGIIAGGKKAVFEAVEGAEDNREGGSKDLASVQFTKNDVLVGISASGRTPYVLGAMDYAKQQEAVVIAVTCCKNSEMSKAADIDISPEPGPEVITGSTRMKSGTAQKMVLNMLSTGVMIRLGKVYGNLMVDVKPSNQKLVRRCITIVCNAAGVNAETAQQYLKQCDYNPKTAIVMILCKVDAAQAKAMLLCADGKISKAVQE